MHPGENQTRHPPWSLWRERFVTFANYLTRLGACQIFGKRYESLSSKGITEDVASGSLWGAWFIIRDLWFVTGHVTFPLLIYTPGAGWYCGGGDISCVWILHHDCEYTRSQRWYTRSLLVVWFQVFKVGVQALYCHVVCRYSRYEHNR